METRVSHNISDDRKVILAPLREVPEEVVFQLSEATQDKNIKYRYWFDLPPLWANQTNKDPIIGIRSIYTTNTNRFIAYDYKIELIPVNGTGSIDTIEGTIHHWLDGRDTIRPITENFNQWWLTDGTRTHTCPDEEHEWKAGEIQAYYGYDRETNVTNLCFGRGILQTDTITISDEQGEFETEYNYHITITPKSDDTMALFNGDLLVHDVKVKIPIWTRYQCLVKSSIAMNDKNNILGHTRNDPYTPLKYYRLNKGVKRFWIELYETRFHDCPVVFPKKIYLPNSEEKDKIDRDDLFIEAIVCFSGQGML